LVTTLRAARRWPVIVLPLLIGATLAGCGGAKSDDGGNVASLGGQDASQSAAPGANASGEPASSDDAERWLQFTGCLRDQGLDVQDPAIAGGLPGLRNQTGDKEKRKSAIAACVQYAPPGVHGGGMSQEDRQKMLSYMGCLRDNGVQVADPDPSTGLPQKDDRDKFKNPDSHMVSAQKTCMSKLPATIGGSA
jgi:hypothetical protein